ncbi:hypothetical protein CUMW_108650 [Citrus unshiu]|nr:hypothetical protein CUMW_108650 [Citrus unshiu]
MTAVRTDFDNCFQTMFADGGGKRRGRRRIMEVLIATKPSLELFRVICMPEGCSCSCNHRFHFTRLV